MRIPLAAAVAVGAVVVLAGCGAATPAPREVTLSELPVPPTVAVPGASASEAPSPTPSVTSTPPTPVVEGAIAVTSTDPRSAMPDPEVAPTRLAIAGLDIAMPVVPVGVEADGQMEVPSKAATAGWYQHGPGLSAGKGHVVLAAHVDDATGLGPFARLRDAKEGEEIVLRGEGETRRYTIVRVEQTDKQEVDLDGVFSRTGEEMLVLVTCGGSFDWDERHYSDNVIVWAQPVAGQR